MATETKTDLISTLKIEKKRILAFILAITVFIVGWMAAPADYPAGDYTIEIAGTVKDLDFVENFTVTLDGSEDDFLMEDRLNFYGYYVHLRYRPVYVSDVGKEVEFWVAVSLHGEPLTLKSENLEARVFAEDIDTDLRPSKVVEKYDQTWSVYKFRPINKAGPALGLLLAVSLLWLTEAVPLAAAALLVPIVIVVFGLGGATYSLECFFDPVIALFMAGFLIAAAMKKTGFDELIALRIVAWSSSNPKMLMLSMMTLTAFMSMWMSNTASATVMIPIAIAVVSRIDAKDTSYKKSLILGIAYSATLGGIGSAIGTPANPLAIGMLNTVLDIEVSFTDWMWFGIPTVIVMIPLVWFYLSVRYKHNVTREQVEEAKKVCEEKLEEMGPLNQAQTAVGVIFLITMGLWLTQSIHGISASIVAIIGAVLCFMVGILGDKALNNINWNALLTFGGGLALGTLIVDTGVAGWIADHLAFLEGWHPFLVYLVLAFIAVGVSALASNTASAAMLLPIAIPLAVCIGVNPIVAAVIISIASSIDFALVIGTPPTMIAYSTGYFKTDEIFKLGIWLDMLGIIVLTILGFLTFDWIAEHIVGYSSNG